MYWDIMQQMLNYHKVCSVIASVGYYLEKEWKNKRKSQQVTLLSAVTWQPFFGTFPDIAKKATHHKDRNLGRSGFELHNL